MKEPSIRETSLLEVVKSVRQLANGRSKSAGVVTLTTSTTTTQVASDIISSDAGAHLFPTTASAAAEFGAGTIYVSAIANGSFTITHANNASTDRSYHWIAIGG